MLEILQLLGALARRDVLADAAVALERARAVENRLAADAGVFQPAVAGGPLQLQIAKRLVRLEHRAMRRPVRLRHVERRRVPARLPDAARRTALVAAARGVRHAGEAEILVLLPIPVRGQLREAAKAPLPLAHH